MILHGRHLDDDIAAIGSIRDGDEARDLAKQLVRRNIAHAVAIEDAAVPRGAQADMLGRESEDSLRTAEFARQRDVDDGAVATMEERRKRRVFVRAAAALVDRDLRERAQIAAARCHGTSENSEVGRAEQNDAQDEDEHEAEGPALFRTVLPDIPVHGRASSTVSRYNVHLVRLSHPTTPTTASRSPSL